MKRSKTLLAGCLCLAVLVPAWSQEMPPDMGRYFVGLIYRGAAWSPQVTPEVMEIQEAHLANIRRLADTGEMVLAGPFSDGGELRGLFVYNVESLEKAETLVQTDPAVKSGRLRVELHPWWGPKAIEGLLDTPRGSATLSAADRAAISAVSESWLSAARAGDWAGVAAMYTEDAVLMAPGEPAIEGRRNIQAYWEAFPPVTGLSTTNVEIEGSGDLAFVRGTYRFTIEPEGGEPVLETGKFVEIRRRQADGTWRLDRDIFNAD